MNRDQQEGLQAFATADRRLQLMEALNFRTHEVWTPGGRAQECQIYKEFSAYLLVEIHPHQKIVLVLDNAANHRSQANLTVLSLLKPRVRVF